MTTLSKNTNRGTAAPTTPEAIAAEQARLAEAIAASDARIGKRWQQLTAPPDAANAFRLWVNRAETAYSVYDGFMTGYKLLRSLGLVWRWRKKKAPRE